MSGTCRGPVRRRTATAIVLNTRITLNYGGWPRCCSPPEILKAKLAYESGLNPGETNDEYVGIAQLGKQTAKTYGLKVDGNVDERLKPELAIPAAAKFLGDLKRKYQTNSYSDNDSIRFALAAYNIGTDKVRLQLELSQPFMKNGKISYIHPSMTFLKGTYVPIIMGLQGDIGALAGMYKNDFLRDKL